MGPWRVHEKPPQLDPVDRYRDSSTSWTTPDAREVDPGARGFDFKTLLTVDCPPRSLLLFFVPTLYTSGTTLCPSSFSDGRYEWVFRPTPRHDRVPRPKAWVCYDDWFVRSATH